MTNLVIKKKLEIKNMIYEIRGMQVMVDSDLAKLYQVETKRINEAVKRNIEKFPERFAFRINENEYNYLKSQTATSRGGARKGHFVFTEQGVAMLATILKSNQAIQISIAIMDAFVIMRKYVSNNLVEQKHINNLVLKHDEDIRLLQDTFNNFKVRNDHIFLKIRSMMHIHFC